MKNSQGSYSGVVVRSIIVMTLIATFSSVFIGGCNLAGSTATPAPLEVTTGEIWNEYQANEARANQTYKERDLKVTFRVDEIEDDHVIEDLDGFLNKANLKFKQGELIRFDIGDTATAICRLEGLDLDIWLRFDCRESSATIHK